MHISKWGGASLIALLAVVPVGALGWRLAGPAPVSEIPGVICMVIAVISSAVAAWRGNGWWLAVTAFSGVWTALTVLQMISHHH